MKEKIKRLGDAELEIMLIIWEAKKPMTSTSIQENFSGQRNWALSTLMTTLARLVDKGFIHCDRSSRTNYYHAIISEETYKARESKGFLKKLHGNSIKSLITSLYADQIDENDLEELRELLDELSGGKDDDHKSIHTSD